MAKYIPIGEPLNEAEKDGIRALRDQLPSHYTVIGNFELRIPNRANTFEFDAIIIGEHAIYAVEIKGWSDPILVDSRQWRLDWGRVQNPFIVLEQKTKALRGFLTQSIPELPMHVECRGVLYLPRAQRFSGGAFHDATLTKYSDLHEAFIDRKLITAHGPGPLLDVSLRSRVEGTLLPAIGPSAAPAVISDYEIEAELESKSDLYREFVGKHKLLASRNKVRIKRFALDPLIPRAERQRAFVRVLREMEAITLLDTNPYIARGFDVIRDRDDELNFYLVTEWVGAQTLADLASADNPENAPDRTKLALHLLEAVSFMHSRGIVHRNLSPEVVFVTNDESAPLKITDFEYARIQDMPSVVGSIVEIDSVGCVAPELWRGQTHDHRVDIFSCAAIVFELITGETLFTSVAELADPSHTWNAKRDKVPRDTLAHELELCLSEDLALRPEDLGGLIRALRE